MNYMLYLLVIVFVLIVYKLIAEKRAKSARAQAIEPCRVFGAPGQLEEDYFDSHVRCSNQYCAMAGPKGCCEIEALERWNNLPRMSTIIAWQFQAAGLALALQRLEDRGQSLRNAQWLAGRYSCFATEAHEVGREFDAALVDAQRTLGIRS